MASPSGFSLARPTLACLVFCLASPPVGVASPTQSGVPVTASLARVAVSLTLDFTSSIFWLTLSLAREGTSALVADGLDGLAHLGPGLLYVLSDRIWVLAHSTSSFTVSTVCSGTTGARLILAWPCLTRT